MRQTIHSDKQMQTLTKDTQNTNSKCVTKTPKYTSYVCTIFATTITWVNLWMVSKGHNHNARHGFSPGSQWFLLYHYDHKLVTEVNTSLPFIISCYDWIFLLVLSLTSCIHIFSLMINILTDLFSFFLFFFTPFWQINSISLNRISLHLNKLQLLF